MGKGVSNLATGSPPPGLNAMGDLDLKATVNLSARLAALWL
jgi:hypothetical protein